MAVRAIRGATQCDADEAEHLLQRVGELVGTLLKANALAAEDVISVVLTSTPDLTAAYPALGARLAGLTDVPMLGAVEVAVPDGLPRVVRLLAHVETDLPRGGVNHVYLHGARVLRSDLAHDITGPEFDPAASEGARVR